MLTLVLLKDKQREFLGKSDSETSLLLHMSKTSQAFDILIHSRALLAAILCWFATHK